MRDGGVYACFEGPRFESPAEIRMARLLGAAVAGMTGVPEVTLAAEAGLRYAAVSLVVNPAAEDATAADLSSRAPSPRSQTTIRPCVRAASIRAGVPAMKSRS